ncbi:MAG: GNAT family N-acetyltransferase [Reyranella sp.]|uniref:GNAT family N-acetyltransferase n=1 Tax=Reyranella sp. TaxID=1929291 RepID=UPI003D09B4CC
MNFPPRTTSRLLLRSISPGDWPAIHRYMSDPSVMAWLPRDVLDVAGARAFAEKNAGEQAEALAVIVAASGELAGHMVFHPWIVTRTHEIGWVFGTQHQRQGYATEAARSLLTYAFEILGCHRVIATCQPENVASWRVMEKLGMRREGHFRACLHRPPHGWWDEYFYALLAEEYFADTGCLRPGS